jgi:hypothetical protein
MYRLGVLIRLDVIGMYKIWMSIKDVSKGCFVWMSIYN